MLPSPFSLVCNHQHTTVKTSNLYSARQMHNFSKHLYFICSPISSQTSKLSEMWKHSLMLQFLNSISKGYCKFAIQEELTLKHAEDDTI